MLANKKEWRVKLAKKNHLMHSKYIKFKGYLKIYTYV
jgi:hypothetical protein